MIDGLNSWAEAVPIANQRTVTGARAVYSEWIAHYVVPERIDSDRGVQFESALCQELFTAFEIEKSITTPYRLQANGKCERFNRTLITMLHRTVASRSYDWEPLLPTVLKAYRSTVSESKGFTFRRLLFVSRDVFPDRLRFAATRATAQCSYAGKYSGRGPRVFLQNRA